jgi:hypothetical protein
VAGIRRDSRAGLSVRGLAGKYQVSRRTVRSALSSAWPAPRKAMPPRPSELDTVKPVIDDILRADLDGPRKRRHTVKRIYDRWTVRCSVVQTQSAQSAATAAVTRSIT